MASAFIKIDNLKETRDALAALARDIPGVVSPILKRTLRPVADAVAAQSPRRTGRLAGSVEVLEHPVHGGFVRSEAVVDARYAAAVDLGARGRHPERFLEDAFDSTAQDAANTAERDIVAELTDSLKH